MEEKPYNPKDLLSMECNLSDEDMLISLQWAYNDGLESKIPPIVVIPSFRGDESLICDGNHRAATAMFNNSLVRAYEVLEFEDIERLLKGIPWCGGCKGLEEMEARARGNKLYPVEYIAEKYSNIFEWIKGKAI